jgi:hypothetical protein
MSIHAQAAIGTAAPTARKRSRLGAGPPVRKDAQFREEIRALRALAP